MMDPMPKPRKVAPPEKDQGEYVSLERFVIGVAMTCMLGAGWFLGSAFPLF